MSSADDMKMKVLIVDDSPTNIHVLLETLRSEYVTMVATSGEKALQITGGKSLPDIILLDINMPVMDGYELCRRLKSKRRTAGIPVIFVTAKSSEEDERKGFELGAVDYIHKPFSPVVVKTRIRNHLKLRRYQEHLEELVENRTAELRLALERAEEASRAKSAFLATMSHELRTPLNSVIGFTDLICRKEYGDLGPEQEEYLGYVLVTARHLLSLINNILDLTKIESGRLLLCLDMVEVRPLLVNSVTIAREQAQRKNIAVEIDIDPSLPPVIRMDEQKIKQVLVNLLSNAVKFTPPHGSVTVSTRPISGEECLRYQYPGSRLQDGTFYLISISDTGIGIQQEDLQRIFEPFVQADNSATRRHEGSGLGLALSKMIVEQHGGVIWAESTAGNGSCFRFVLPL